MQPNDDQNNLQPNTQTPTQPQGAPAPQASQPSPATPPAAPLEGAIEQPAPIAEPQPQEIDNSAPQTTLPPEFDQYTIDPEAEAAFRESDPSAQQQTIEWRASEYIHHDKGVLWFLALGAVTIAAAAIAFLLNQWMFGILIVVMGFAMGFFAKRPPHEINYSISSKGITVGEKVFPFTQFKSFGVLEEGAFYSVQLRPSKRFAPGVSIYFAHDDGEKIFDALAAHLPAEEINHDPFDRLMRKLRF